MKYFYKAWIANDDKEVEGKWEDWYTDKVDGTRIWEIFSKALSTA